MSRSYNPKPWEDKTGVAFVSGGPDANRERVSLRHEVSYSPQGSRLSRLKEEWDLRRPYYIIMFLVGFIVALALGLLIYASRG